MKTLITGTDGYLGCLLAPELMRRDHEVVGVDTGFYKYGWLYAGTDLTPLTLSKDIRHLTESDLDRGTIGTVILVPEVPQTAGR